MFRQFTCLFSYVLNCKIHEARANFISKAHSGILVGLSNIYWVNKWISHRQTFVCLLKWSLQVIDCQVFLQNDEARFLVIYFLRDFCVWISGLGIYTFLLLYCWHLLPWCRAWVLVVRSEPHPNGLSLTPPSHTTHRYHFWSHPLTSIKSCSPRIPSFVNIFLLEMSHAHFGTLLPPDTLAKPLHYPHFMHLGSV